MKKILIKAAVLIAIFILAIAMHFVITNKREKVDEEVMQTASLPIVSMMYDDIVVNTIHGYTISMDARYMRDCITPVESDRTLSMNINIYDNVIAGISYELRSLDTERLIEKTNVPDYSVAGDSAKTTLNLSSMMEENEEYLLILKIVTEKHGEINYYTRVINQSAANIANHIEFVSGFSKGILNDDTAKEYMPYLEPSSQSDNTNLAKVNLYSSYSNVTWGDLEVERVTEPIITIKEILGDVGCYELRYKVRAKNGFDIYQYYNVTEYFRVREGINVMYMYVYERNMEQIFECNTQSVSSTRINLGLDSDLTVETSWSPTGSYMTFVKERNLWLMDMNKNEMISIMSFESGSDRDVRDVFNENNIEIVSTDKSGDVLFLVYGYMNKGEHEGEVGIALYQYKYETNIVEELVFVITDKPYHILKGSVGKFAYITEDGLIYLMVEDSIYTITTDSNEYVQLVNNLQSGNFIINSENNIVAWHENGSVYSANSIRVIDVEAGEDYKITVDEGDYVKVIGFIGDDLVYGVAHSADVYTDDLGKIVFPMYELRVDLYDSKEEETYSKEGIYIKEVTIEKNMLNMKRLVKNGGVFEETSDDQLINKISEKTATVGQSTIVTDLKKTELILELAYTITSNNDLSSKSPEKINFVSANDIGKEDTEIADSNFYVYGNGKMLLATQSVTAAINMASEQYGVVVDGNGHYVWARVSKLDNKVVASATEAASPNYASIGKIFENVNIKVLDVSGIDIQDILYYTTKDIPVLTFMQDYGVVAISGYSGYMGVVDTVYFRNSGGESFNLTINAARKAIEESGHRYIAVLEQ
ncbi:MAG: hypothetical protein GX225_04145 [Clostridiales bacterium]|nr:hypothetical protein [Clostridiales bacterium]